MITSKDLTQVFQSKIRQNSSAIGRFWLHVDKKFDNECWEWKAAITPNGYGKIQIKKETCFVHRVSWMIHFGDIPEGLCVCHHCDNKKCVNPKHLFLGTQRDNCQDAAKKGRTLRGERNSASKLTEFDVVEIRSLQNYLHPLEIATIFGVSNATIYDIFAGRTWSWVKL